MRKEFIETSDKEEANNQCPWASIITEVVGGYWCFESWTDYEIWISQT